MLRGREEAECARAEELTVSWVQRLRPAVPRQAVIQIYSHRAAAALTRTQTRSQKQHWMQVTASLQHGCRRSQSKDCNHIKP